MILTTDEMGLETQQNSGKSAVELKIVSSSAYLYGEILQLPCCNYTLRIFSLL